jgi:hypothetical protein
VHAGSPQTLQSGYQFRPTSCVIWCRTLAADSSNETHTERPFDNREAAARSRTAASISKINAPFLYTLKATGPEFGAGIKHGVERGWFELHDAGPTCGF